MKAGAAVLMLLVATSLVANAAASCDRSALDRVRLRQGTHGLVFKQCLHATERMHNMLLLSCFKMARVIWQPDQVCHDKP
jgi:hypothetical protein